jgi:hypothetical protein
MKFNELFSTSPFALTASKNSASCWAGREDVLKQVRKLYHAFQHRPDSSLDLVWANLGAGKSHLLYHFGYLLTASGAEKPQNFVSLVEIPQELRGFHDLYTRIIAGLDLRSLADRIIAMPIVSDSHNIMRAARAITFGGPQERELAECWLGGGRPHLTSLKSSTGITMRIETDSNAAEIFGILLNCFAADGTRFVLMIDEFQRMSTMKPQSRDNLLSSLRSFFSKTPQYFSVLLAAAYRLEKTAFDALTPELRTLIGPRPTIALPAMNADEAMEFIGKRFAFYRPPAYSGSVYAPFDEAGIRSAISTLEEHGHQLIPRDILQALAFCFDEYAGSADEVISAPEVSKALALMPPR